MEKRRAARIKSSRLLKQVKIRKISSRPAKMHAGQAHLPLSLVKQGRAQASHSLRENLYGFPLIFPFLPQESTLRR